MPKRKGSFDELPILSKMHIGVKEVDMGVNFEKNMSKVFERTHALLFNGKPNEDHSLPNRNARWSGVACNNSPSDLKAKLAEKKDAVNPMNSCCISQPYLLCSFCEKSVCFNCSRMCHNCKLPFCHLCSVLQYSSHEESAVCLSCH